MTHSTVRRRSRVARTAGVVAAAALAGSGVVATSTAAFAEETAAADVPSLQTFDASDFVEEAADLPSALVDALQRDLGIDGATYLANAAAGNAASRTVEALAEAGVSINGSVFDPASQALTVYLEAEVDVPLVEGVGAKVVVGDAPEAEVPHEFEAYDDFKGGYGYFDIDLGRCSAGFNSYDGNGDPWVLTAGHCNAENADSEWTYWDVDAPHSPNNPDDSPWLNPGPVVGSGGEFQFGGEQDAGRFPATNTDDWTFTAAVSQWGGSTGAPQDGQVAVTDHVDPIVGLEICRSGASSGYQCGEITDVNARGNFGDGIFVTGFLTTACATQGDSGGSYISGTAAVGVLSGGPPTFDPHPEDACSEGWLDSYRSLAYAVSGSENSASQHFGDDFELKVQISTPTVTAPEDGGTTNPTPTFEGTVANGSTHYTARVRIDDGEQYRAQVAADGSFSIPVDDELEAGEHSFELAIGYGQFSRSESVTGTFTVEEIQVEELVVESPEDGQTTGNARPSFTGTGQPGAEVVLTVGDDVVGSATVAEDGTWTIEPESDLPIGKRFDAVVTQTFEGDEQSVTVADLGIKAAAATITVPEDGSEVPGDVVFEGTAHPGSDLAITLVPAGAEEESDAMSLTSFAEGDETEPAEEVWEGEWTFEGNAWTFTPAEPIEAGEYTVTIDAQFGEDAELGASSASSTFTVTDAGGDAGGNDDGGLPDTGSSTTPLIIGAIVLVLAGGAALVTVRARRNGSAA